MIRPDELIIDNFAGGGGASTGIEAGAGRAVDIAVNHDAAAVEMHKANHPDTRHLCEDVWQVDPLQATAGRPVGLAWFSPDCKHFSRAKGAKPVSKKIRGLAWVAIKWARAVRPRVIMLENVREFQEWGPLIRIPGAGHRPCPQRKGSTFKRWASQLRRLGYAVEWRVLNAADYGAPTHRRRLFLVARCDGCPIVWPEPTHGPGRSRPYRTAAECIDWSLPCPSIFLSKEEGRAIGVKRPLADKTLKRIAEGIKRFVLESADPFIVRCAHGDSGKGKPRWGRSSQGLNEPLPTNTASRDFALVAPTLVQTGYGEREGQSPRALDLNKPLGTVVGGGQKHALVQAFLESHLAPALVGVGGRAGQSPPCPVDEPMRTTTAKADRALIAATIVRQNHGEKPADSADEPLRTITTQGNHHTLATATLITLNNNTNPTDLRQPLHAVTAGGLHHAEVRAFLIKYFSTNIGSPCGAPMPTATSKHRFGLVTVAGQEYEIADIGLRMLTPRELARAQGFPDTYTLTGTKTSQVARIGNSVCPVMAEALVRANFEKAHEMEAAA